MIYALLNSIPAPAWLKDADGRYLAANRAFFDSCGRSPAEVIRFTDAEIWPADRAELYSDSDSRVVAGAAPVRIEERAIYPDGTERWFETTKVPYRGDDGELLGTVGVAHDITERRAALLALQESEERYLAVARATNDVIWDLDLRQKKAWWNDELQKAFGIAPADLQCVDDWRAHIHPEDRDRVTVGFLQAIDAGTAWSDEYRFICGDGRFASVLDRGSVLRDREGVPTRMIGSIIDVTRRKQLEEELQQAQKMEAFGRLAGGVAHDFNNLLTVIISYAEMMKVDIRAADPMRDDLEQIVKAAERAAGLTRQLLAFSRRQRLQPRRVDVNDIVTDLEKMLCRLIGEDIHLTMYPSETPAYVVADSGQIEQVLLNLAVNARDALQPGGEIAVMVSSVMRAAANAPGTAMTKHVQISVADNGAGIPPEILPRIFEPFFTTKPAGAGTGLGLATVYGIVEQSGGHLEVDTVPGKGTEFKVFLPWDDAGT